MPALIAIENIPVIIRQPQERLMDSIPAADEVI